MAWLILALPTHHVSLFFQQSLCSEMAEELLFAVRCHGPSQKPKYKNRLCLKCKSINSHSPECHLYPNRRESANGVVQMKESRQGVKYRRDAYAHDRCELRDYELDYMHDKGAEFGAGGYLHVEYSDTET